MEILKKLFSIAHWLIFLMDSCSWHSSVYMYLDFDVIKIPYINSRVHAHLVILLIFRLKRFTDSIQPWGTPSSWLWKFDRVDSIWTQIFLFKRKFFMKLGSQPFSPKLCRSFIIPYFQMVSYTFFRLKNITMRCCFGIFTSIIVVSNLTNMSPL